MEKDKTCPITNILFVDGDNKFESAALETFTQCEADNRDVDIIASSVGVNATDGEGRSELVYMVRLNFDYTKCHVSKYYQILRGATRRMTPERLENADLIVLLSNRYEADVKAMLPQNQWHKIVPFHLYCLGNRRKEFPEHALQQNERNFYPDFLRACSKLILRIQIYSFFEDIQRKLEELRQAFIEKYYQQLVDGFTEEELMVTANHGVILGDGIIWLRLLRYDSASYSLDIMIKDEHNSSEIGIAYGSLEDIRQALYCETFARDYAMTYRDLEISYVRHLD
jgi:hypothetical protein